MACECHGCIQSALGKSRNRSNILKPFGEIIWIYWECVYIYICLPYNNILCIYIYIHIYRELVAKLNTEHDP